jgi:hypothetical protein
MSTLVNYGRRVEYKMPVFNFSIPKINFYINTPGVSVVGPDKYLTTESSGKFKILNPNTTSIYFNNLTYVKAQHRDSKINSTLNTLKLNLVNEYDETDLVGSENITGTKHYQEYQVTNNGKLIGKLTLVIPVGLLGSNKMLLPLTTLEFSAFYEVLNLNVLNTHDPYIKTSLDPEKKVGVIDLTFNIKCFTDNTFNNVVNEEVVISVILVKT